MSAESSCMQAQGHRARADLLPVVKEELVRVDAIRDGAPDDGEDVEDDRRSRLASRQELHAEVSPRNPSARPRIVNMGSTRDQAGSV